MMPSVQRSEEFVRLFPDTPAAVLAQRFGVSPATIARWARQLGLRKSHDYLAELHRQASTGRIHSPETRAKIAAAHAGITWTDAQREKMQARVMPSGPDHYKWKGGRTWQRFSDERYTAWRLAVLERDGYICRDCGTQRRKYEKGLAAHHLQSYADHPDLRYTVANGVTLCRKCHMTRHGRPPRAARRIECACGCGTPIDSVDPYGRSRLYVNHHAKRQATASV